jgi:hypothetical protein
MNELNKLVNPCGEQLCGRSERYSGTRVSPTCSSSSLKNITNAFPAPTTTPILAERAGNQNLLALVVAMLIFAILTLSLTVLTMWHGPVALQLIKIRCRSPHEEVHTLILLSRHGTQAVVTCLRGAFFGRSGSGDMARGPGRDLGYGFAIGFTRGGVAFGLESDSGVGSRKRNWTG